MAPSETNLSQWRERDRENRIVIEMNSSASSLVGIDVKFDYSEGYDFRVWFT